MAARSVRHICCKTTSSFCKRLIFIVKRRCLISMQQPNCLMDQWLECIFGYLATILSTVYVNREPAIRSHAIGFPLLKKSARQKYRLNSMTLSSIKGLAHNLFHKLCAENRSHRDATITQWRRGRSSRSSRRVCCA